MRSAAKPFQAAVSQTHGADLSPRQLAVASSSHGGEPVHLAIVAEMLDEVGLGPEHLLCPADYPLGADAARITDTKTPIQHNCSGKHAAMLRACVAQGWDLDYARPDHPLQEANYAIVADVTGMDPGPVGVDGCGVPTLRTTTRGLATAFARLATDPQFAEVAAAMHQYPYLTAGSGRIESVIGVAVNAAVKGGAKGCLGVALLGQAGLAVKSDDGLMEPTGVATVEMLRRLSVVPQAAAAALAKVGSPPVLGGGEAVGHWETGLD